jgi:hypothetical protein
VHACTEIDACEEVGRERIKDRYVRHEQCLSRASRTTGSDRGRGRGNPSTNMKAVDQPV